MKHCNVCRGPFEPEGEIQARCGNCVIALDAAAIAQRQADVLAAEQGVDLYQALTLLQLGQGLQLLELQDELGMTLEKIAQQNAPSIGWPTN